VTAKIRSHSPATLVLQRNRRKRIEAGHPWVYQSEVARLDGQLEPGGVVHIANHQGMFLARGLYNPQSQIVARILTYDKDEAIDGAFFTRRIGLAWTYRQRFLGDTNACRVVYGEADFLPGLIVDKYGDVLSVQILSLGMDQRQDLIRDALVEVFQPRGIYLRGDVPVRRLEGLPLETRVWMGDVPDVVEIEENGLRFLVDVKEGQKTGYFFDQRENRAAMEPLMRGWGQNEGAGGLGRAEQAEADGRPEGVAGWLANDQRPDGANVLDCFCHTGAFTMHAMKYGAQHVTAVDSSESAIEVAQQNAKVNGFAGHIDFVVANAFDYLRDADAQRRQYDVVILDPPAFAKSRNALEGAIRGYKEINLRGMKLVHDGGFLVTASCSFHLKPELFREMILAAAVDAHKVLRLVHESSAGKDHPEIAGVEEGHYLKFAIYQVFSR